MKPDWSQFAYINEKMNWGDASKMDAAFLYTLDSWCIFEKKGIFITPHGGTSGNHKPGSMHYVGKACDFIVLNASLDDSLDVFVSLSRFPFTEIGIYPDWHYNGKKVGGFHVGLDNRQMMVRKKLWIGLKGVGEENLYIGVTKKNLIKYCGF